MFGKHTFSLKARLVRSEAQVQPSLVGSKDISMVVFFFFQKKRKNMGWTLPYRLGLVQLRQLGHWLSLVTNLCNYLWIIIHILHKKFWDLTILKFSFNLIKSSWTFSFSLAITNSFIAQHVHLGISSHKALNLV